MGIEVRQPASMSEVAEMAASCDLGVLVAFGRLIRPELLAAPRLGIVNVHFSLLPRWRGAAPVQRAILEGDARSGVTLMQMDEGLDTGPILASASTPINDSEDAGALTERLATLGADLLAGELAALVAGELAPIDQPDEGVTLAPRFSPDDARIDTAQPAGAVLAVIRAFSPRPGAWGLMDGERFKVLAAQPAQVSGPAGEVFDHHRTPVLGTATEGLELLRVQPAGKGQMTGIDWFNGRSRRPTALT
jgi:methionyl-tRNA formyltransferase